MTINGVALASVSIGSVLLWSGIKGWNLSRTIGEIITGNVPKGTNENPLTAPNDGSSNASVGLLVVVLQMMRCNTRDTHILMVAHRVRMGKIPGIAVHLLIGLSVTILIKQFPDMVLVNMTVQFMVRQLDHG